MDVSGAVTLRHKAIIVITYVLSACVYVVEIVYCTSVGSINNSGILYITSGSLCHLTEPPTSLLTVDQLKDSCPS